MPKGEYDTQVCVDINLSDTPYNELFQRKYRLIMERRSYGRGEIMRREASSRTRLEGQEKPLFSGIAEHFISGVITGIDGVFKNGINVAANVTSAEYQRIGQDKDRFTVTTVRNI